MVSNRRECLGWWCFWGCSDAPATGAHRPVKVLVEHVLLPFLSCLLLTSTQTQTSWRHFPEILDLAMKVSPIGCKFQVVNRNTKFKINKFLSWLETVKTQSRVSCLCHRWEWNVIWKKTHNPLWSKTQKRNFKPQVSVPSWAELTEACLVLPVLK